MAMVLCPHPRKRLRSDERRTLNPTLDVIQKVAEGLEVSPAQLIGDNNGLMKTNRKTGPTSKVQKVFEDVSSLPPPTGKDH
jgi:hypothetical protein